jgi:hypothetical protein
MHGFMNVKKNLQLLFTSITPTSDFMLHIQLSLEQQYVPTKGHAAMGNVTYQPTLVL